MEVGGGEERGRERRRREWLSETKAGREREMERRRERWRERERTRGGLRTLASKHCVRSGKLGVQDVSMLQRGCVYCEL